MIIIALYGEEKKKKTVSYVNINIHKKMQIFIAFSSWIKSLSNGI